MIFCAVVIFFSILNFAAFPSLKSIGQKDNIGTKWVKLSEQDISGAFYEATDWVGRWKSMAA